ncbi:hypothetical protein [Tsuneonella suprasediminis]|uniref:hypothetical protein n=1 Tax=Tsuneonella suprasediminis TaxID=2306996 RepID=UPI002F927086
MNGIPALWFRMPDPALVDDAAGAVLLPCTIYASTLAVVSGDFSAFHPSLSRMQ